MKYALLLIGMLFLNSASGQENVTVSTSPAIDQMMDKFTNANRAQKSIKGWRIQIITTDDRRKMEAARGKFLGLYPDVEVKWNHVAPYYRVKVGAYENKMQLMGFLLELKNDFPGVIPVMDNIKKSELVGN
ncbi:MAG: hypothetical protein ACJATI_000305 [Halioglobus sp.]|jgi:hypothetical protein